MNTDNADEVKRWLDKVRDDVGKVAAARGMYRIGQLVRTTAIAYAPKSPSQKELDRFREAEWKLRGKKPSKAQKAAWKAKRDPRATSRPKPGGLMRSISMTSDATNATVFCAMNSEAGKYAYKMHELKGKKWIHRGIGTIAKGAKADEKFITRAIADTRQKQVEILRNEIDKALSKGNQ